MILEKQSAECLAQCLRRKDDQPQKRYPGYMSTTVIKVTRRNWSREETMMAFALYMILEPRECDDKGFDVQRLAAAIHRTPNSVALKIWNIAAHDANRQARGRVGMQHGSKLDVEIWEWYTAEGDEFLSQCLTLLHQALLSVDSSTMKSAPDRLSSVESASQLLVSENPKGAERLTLTVQRVNQCYFRNSLMTNYSGRCCMTGITVPRLLIASHIKPWAVSTPMEKTAASNGLLLNALHDRAFDQGFITLDDDYRIVVSHGAVRHTESNDKWLYALEGQRIHLPHANPPSHEFLEYHHKHVFLDSAA